MNIDHHYSFWQRWYRCIVCQKHTIHLSFCSLQIIQVTHILGTNISIRIRIVFFSLDYDFINFALSFIVVYIIDISLHKRYVFVYFSRTHFIMFSRKNIQIQILEDANCIFSQSKRVLAIHFFFKAYRPQMYHFPIIFLQPKKFRSNDSHKYTS